MQIYDEKDLMDVDFRKQVIAEIEGKENILRKQESYKRYEVLKDRLKKYVLENLHLEMDNETVEEMQSRVPVINLYKKVISKKARVYQVAPERSVEDSEQENFDKLLNCINLNTTMKKANRYVEAFRNCLIYARPVEKNGKYYIQLRVLAPHSYDVIEDQQNPETARCVILSDFSNNTMIVDQTPNDREQRLYNKKFRDGDDENQVIADSPADADKPKKLYTFWSDTYHFTCDARGQIVKAPEGALNPIGELPFTTLAKDQDGSYWALGGEDLIDGTILTNMLMTDLYFIAKVQGMGLFYFFGKGVPKTMKIGPNRALTHEVGEDDPTPQVGFASSNPPLQDHMEMVEQYIALLLTTNDLGVNAVASKLDGRSAISGVQELIQNSEPMNAVEDDQEMFRDAEPEILRKVALWHNYYGDKNALVDKFEKIGKLPDLIYEPKFKPPVQYKTEEQKLASAKAKKDLGIADAIKLIMEVYDIDEQAAEKEFMKILERQLKERSARLEGAMNANQEKQDQLQARSDEGPKQDSEVEGSNESEERNS